MKKNLANEIYDYLIAEIREHRLLPGGQLPSENTLCRQFYVSRPTVRKAIARLCEGGYVQSRPGLGSYVTSGQSDAPVQPVNRLIIGIDGVDFHDEYQYYTRISQGARAAAEAAGVMLCLTDLPELLNSPFRKVDAFIATRVDRDDFENAALLQRNGIPLVLLNRYPPQPELAYISVDFQYETFLVISRMLKNGARNIALIGRQTGSVTSAGRTRGWEEAYKANGLPVPQHLAVDFQDFRHDDDILPEFFRRNRVDVAFVTAGYQLPPVLTALARVGMQLPDDLDVLCFDDIERLCETVNTPISYIKMPLQAMGARAVEYLVRRLTCPNLETLQLTMNASLVVNRCKYLL